MLSTALLFLALQATPADAAFLAGPWEELREGPRGSARFEEHWLAERAGLMLGVARATRGEGADARVLGFEFLRIEFRAGGEAVYLAQPQGRPATEFRLTALTPGQALRFENPAHDFPKTIRYELQADGSLLATVEGGGRSMSWRFKRR